MGGRIDSQQVVEASLPVASDGMGILTRKVTGWCVNSSGLVACTR